MHSSLFVFMEKIDFSYSIDTTLVFVGPPWNARNMYTCLKRSQSLAQGRGLRAVLWSDSAELYGLI